MSTISVGGTAFIKAQPQEIIEHQKINSQSSITTALTDIPPSVPSYIQQPGVKVWKAEEIYAMADQIAKNHKRPISDSEYRYFINVLKSQGMTTEKLYYDYELYAIAASVYANMKLYKVGEEIDPIVMQFIDDIVRMPASSGPAFSAQMEHLWSDKWFGQSVIAAQDKYSQEEKIRLGANNIAFVDIYLADKNAKAEAQKIIDSSEDARNEAAASEAAGVISLMAQPAVVAAAQLVEKSQAQAPVKESLVKRIFKKADPLTYEQAVHPMLRYNLVKKK